MLEAIVSLTGLGFVAAFGLGLASKKFHVEVDPRLEKIEEMLPGLNCGGCGYPGCSGFAEGLLAGEVEVTSCAPAGEEVVAQLADFLGLEVSGVVRKIAVLKCGGGVDKAVIEALYEGVEDCRAAVLLGGGGKSCRYSCVGYSTCEKVCPFEAITMGADGLPVVDPDLCTACNKCVVACPRDVLVLEPVDHQVIIRCSSPDPAGKIKKVCSVGCTGCGICEKVCPVDAALLDGSLASIDPERCVECGICAAKCPADTITDGLLPRKTVVISEACNGCTICARVCPFDAIAGEAKELHLVDPEKCVGCQLCIPRCSVQAIAQTGPPAPMEG
ncbi:MAG: RnfABCDGE type electron transport complex subunit B [bacterium]|nr:MAG: RnfABCDGE type electron transport complex subunit B [bacterium]